MNPESMSPEVRKQTQKLATSFIYALITGILAGIFWVWTIVEFLIYLFKDSPFYWLIFIIAIFLSFLSLIYYFQMLTSRIIISVKQDADKDKEKGVKRSKWQQRLEEAAKNRKN